MGEFEYLRLEISEGLAIITLSRPESGNALHGEACAELEQAAALLTERNADIRAVLLNAEGKSFCVGGDIKAMTACSSEELPSTLRAMAEKFHNGVLALSRLDAPLVAAVRGAAAGAGLSLVASADYVIASTNARFLLAYPVIGLTPDGGGTWFLPRVIGLRRTAEMMLDNRVLDACEAVNWGLVTCVVDDAALDDEALALARRIASGPTAAFGRIKRLLAVSLGSDLASQLDRELASIAAAGATSDATEGIVAFTERRAAIFSGK